MAQQIEEKDKPLLVLLPMVVNWIKSGKNLTDKEIRSMARLHPKEFEYAKRNPIAEMRKVAEKYKDHKIYRDLIEVVLSERGRKWVEVNANACHRLGLEKDH